MIEIGSFLTDIRLALVLNPMRDPNETVRKASQAMLQHRLYLDTDCDMHVKGGASHPRPYDVLKPAIEMHKEITDG